MPGRESHRPDRDQSAPGTMKTSGPFRREDSSAPSTPTAPPSSAVGVTLTTDTLAWLHRHGFHRQFIDAARRDRDHGQSLPDGFPSIIRAILDVETANPIAAFGQAELTSTKLDPSDRHSLSAVAERFGLAKRTLRHWCETGQVHAEQPGQHGHWKVSATSVAARLQQKRNP